MYRALASSIGFAFFAAFSCAAQSTESGSQAQTQASPPASPQCASTEANPTGSAASNQTKKKPRKVWTNEEISSVGGNISVVGDPSQTRHAEEATNPTKGNTAQRIDAYRKQILQLRGQMDSVDKQIADFHNSKPGEASKGMDPRLRYTTTSPEDRVKQLEDKKKQIQAKIDAIEETARKEGIEAGQLR